MDGKIWFFWHEYFVGDSIRKMIFYQNWRQNANLRQHVFVGVGFPEYHTCNENDKKIIQ